MPHTASTDALAHRELQVETPEHVAIGYALADLGSRFAALLLDGAIVFGSLGALFVGVPLLARRFGAIPEGIAGWGLAALVLIGFTLVWGYFVYFEGLRDGQTPGKRTLGIRVVHEGGYPLTVRGAAVRNLLRLVDVQPIPSWLVGGVTMLLHPRTQRLGDMAAGTIVVRERIAALLPEELATPSAGALGPPRLPAATLVALGSYVARRSALEPEVRHRIAGRLAAPLREIIAADSRGRQMTADAYLVLLHGEESARHAAAGGVGGSGSAQAAALVRSQRTAWNEYLELLARARKRGVQRLPEEKISRFASLYRGVAADLARARSYGGSAELVYSLERWVGAGHNLLYRPAQRSWRLLGRWLGTGFPALVRRRWRPIALAAALFALPALVTFAAVRLEPTRARDLVPAGMIARAEEAEQRGAEGKGYVDVPEVFMPVMATGIMANNVQVTFAAFAGGVLAGLGTVLILLFNGVHLGSVAGLFANHAASLHLWTFVLPHGVIEITAICIAGGAGIWLGSALLLPGRRTRGEMLVERGREAVMLLAGTTSLLVIAGAIEGFISPSALPRTAKLAAAALFALLLFAYLGLAGRGGVDPEAATASPVA
jgi:uncharacterized membrane protein SpoIIM required for sporulation/uncharacterized RDD family membrane protein YckC